MRMGRRVRHICRFERVGKLIFHLIEGERVMLSHKRVLLRAPSDQRFHIFVALTFEFAFFPRAGRKNTFWWAEVWLAKTWRFHDRIFITSIQAIHHINHNKSSASGKNEKVLTEAWSSSQLIMKSLRTESESWATRKASLIHTEKIWMQNLLAGCLRN